MFLYPVLFFTKIKAHFHFIEICKTIFLVIPLLLGIQVLSIFRHKYGSGHLGETSVSGWSLCALPAPLYTLICAPEGLFIDCVDPALLLSGFQLGSASGRLWRRGQEQEVVLERGGGFATLLKATASSIAQICLIQNSCPPLPLCLEVVMISCCWEPWAAPLFCIDFPLLALIL